MAVGRDCRAAGDAIAKAAVCADADEQCRAADQVAHKHIAHVIRITRHQVTGAAFEQRVTAIRRDVHRQGIAIASGNAREVHAHQSCRSARAVPQKDVQTWRNPGNHGGIVAGYQEVVGRAGKEDVSAVGANDGHQRISAGARGWRLARRQSGDELKSLRRSAD